MSSRLFVFKAFTDKFLEEFGNICFVLAFIFFRSRVSRLALFASCELGVTDWVYSVICHFTGMTKFTPFCRLYCKT